MKTYPFSLPVALAQHQSGLPLLYPLFQPQWIRLEPQLEELNQPLAQALEKDVLRQGNYEELLHLDWGQVPRHQSLTVTLQADENQRYPELDLEFDLLWASIRPGHWVGVIPALGLQTSATSEPQLRQAAKDLVRLEMMRNQRLGAIPKLIETQWARVKGVDTLDLELPIYTLKELKDIENQPGASLLEQVAQVWEPEAIEVYGLDEARAQVQRSLSQRRRQSVLVTGGPGRGKTALLQHVVTHRQALGLPAVKVWEVTAAQLLQGLTSRGGWQGKLQELCDELQKRGEWLYLPNFVEMFEVGQYSGNSQSMADFLRPRLMRGEITLLTECTPEELAAMERRAPGYAGLFATVDLPSQDSEALLHVILSRSQDMARQQELTLTEGAVRETLRLMQWFTPYSGLPGKAIRFLRFALQEVAREGNTELTEAQVYRQFCRDTGLPSAIIDPRAPLDLAEVEAFFQQNIFGQEKAIAAVMDLLVSIKAAVVRRGKPLGSLLFVGPTGVGKTELTKVLAQYLFGRRDQMIRFDMSEYQDLPALLRLTGDDGRGEGLLTAAVRQRPFSVVLFDELEKVNPLFYDMLLQILGEGRLTSSSGRVADFSSTLIIMTSNLGAKDYQSSGVGYTSYQDQEARAAEHFIKSVQAHFRPELFNRLDRIVPFAPLGIGVMRAIVDRELRLIGEREGLRRRLIRWEIGEGVYDFLSRGGYHPAYGARYLQRFLQDHWVARLAHLLFEYPVGQPLTLRVDLTEDGHSLAFVATPWEEVSEKEALATSRQLQVQRLTEYRREGQAVSLGPVYVKFSNRITALRHQENKYRKQGKLDKFWARPESEWYAQALEHELQYQKLLQEVTDLEEEGLLALFLTENNALKNEAIERWMLTWNDWCRRLLVLQFPEWERSQLGIYGPLKRLQTLTALYVRLAEAEGFQVTGEYLWYDDRLATEKKPYQVGILDLKKPDRFPVDAIGVQLNLRGDLVHLFFSGEVGVYLFEHEEGDPSHYFIQATAQPPLAPPEGLHRRKFFREKKFRRVYRGNSVEGEREYETPTQGGEVFPTLQRWLRHRFDQAVRRRLIQG